MEKSLTNLNFNGQKYHFKCVQWMNKHNFGLYLDILYHPRVDEGGMYDDKNVAVLSK